MSNVDSNNVEDEPIAETADDAVVEEAVVDEEVADIDDAASEAEQEALADALADSLAAEEAPEVVADETITLSASEFQALQQENTELKERLLRERADFDNIRKRLRRDGEEAGGRAVARFVSPMLTELDNFGHALEAANPEQFQDFAMGVTMIRDNLLKVLDGAGIAPVEIAGAFDPAIHEVVAEVPSDEPKGHIIAVQRTGYRMGEQLIRAAQVIVSRGAENAGAAAPADAEAAE